MKKMIFAFLAISSFMMSLAQTPQNIEFNKEYKDILVTKSSNLIYKLKLLKGGVYQVAVLQQGVDVILILTDNADKKILDKDSPNGQYGYEKFEYSPASTGIFFLKVNRLDQSVNSDSGRVTVLIKSLTKEEIAIKEKIKKELEPENAKNVQTIDIDHFWEAFDNLQKCKTHADSVASFQKIYLDRGTDGLIDFIRVRDYFTAENYTKVVAHVPKFFNSIRKNTYEAKKAVPLIEDVFAKFKEIYPNFKPFKVCFAIGTISTAGTVSDRFVLIGTEVATSTKDVDLSEFKNSAYSKVLSENHDIVQNLKNTIAHECVHTQQKGVRDSNGIVCPLLYGVMREGFCDFIGELVVGNQINETAWYGDKHEKELWKSFKSQLCVDTLDNWLYNYGNVKDKPADLGYYIGYKIAQEYYKNSVDKKQAVVDIIEMTNPVRFLELSSYDQKEKQ
jgi:Predicted Zn-dependent protease (DUF2268)